MNQKTETPRLDAIVMQLALYQCPLAMESKAGKFVKITDVQKLLREHAVMRRRLLEIASGDVVQPAIHAGAAFHEIDEIQELGGHICQICGIGYELPSGRCDHCNRPFAGFRSA